MNSGSTITEDGGCVVDADVGVTDPLFVCELLGAVVPVADPTLWIDEPPDGEPVPVLPALGLLVDPMITGVLKVSVSVEPGGVGEKVASLMVRELCGPTVGDELLAAAADFVVVSVSVTVAIPEG
jgi:hypothetical protein